MVFRMLHTLEAIGTYLGVCVAGYCMKTKKEFWQDAGDCETITEILQSERIGASAGQPRARASPSQASTGQLSLGRPGPALSNLGQPRRD